MRGHVITQVESGLTRPLTCPSLDCPTPIDPRLAKEELELEDKIVTQYERILRNREIAGDSDRKFCPQPGCEGVVHRPTIMPSKSRFSKNAVTQAIAKQVPGLCDVCSG